MVGGYPSPVQPVVIVPRYTVHETSLYFNSIVYAVKQLCGSEINENHGNSPHFFFICVVHERHIHLSRIFCSFGYI